MDMGRLKVLATLASSSASRINGRYCGGTVMFIVFPCSSILAELANSANILRFMLLADWGEVEHRYRSIRRPRSDHEQTGKV